MVGAKVSAPEKVPLSVHETLKGRDVLVTGFTGFLAKVLVAQLLMETPEIGHIHLVVRARKAQSAEARFLEIVDRNPAFRPVRARYGEALGALLREKITLHEGDVGEPLLGLSGGEIARLADVLDAVIHVAGLTDFKPDPRDALESNVEGALNAADLVERCRKAVLIHTSTCYVAGKREGRIEESVWETTPSGVAWDPNAEMIYLQTLSCHDTTSRDPEEQRRARKVRVNAATGRSHALGFTNTYTYSKALAEALLVRRGLGQRLVIARPAIIECAERFPFAGWNEGINTTGPLLWLCKGYFRHIPSRPEIHFDVVPVDAVTGSLIAITAAALRGEAAPVYQLGSSGSNPFTMGRGFELTNLAIRKHMKPSRDTLERVRPLMDNVLVPADEAHPLSPLRLQRLARSVRSSLSTLEIPRFRSPLLDHWAGKLDRKLDDIYALSKEAERQFGRMQRLFDTYRPFIHDHNWIYENGAIRALTERLDAPSKAAFGWTVDAIDWRHYWIDILYPGLDTWCLPLIEGHEPILDAPSGLSWADEPAEVLASGDEGAEATEYAEGAEGLGPADHEAVTPRVPTETADSETQGGDAVPEAEAPPVEGEDE